MKLFKAVIAALIHVFPVCALAGNSERVEAFRNSGNVLDLEVSSGNLEDRFSGLDIGEATTLVLKGTADVRDFRTLVSFMPVSMVSLDLSGLTISAYTYPSPQADGRTWYDANELPAWSFFSIPLQSVKLPSSLKSIGEGAFANSHLQEIELPEGVENVGDYSFYGCADLRKIIIPKSLNALGREVFRNTSLTSLSFSGPVNFADYSLSGMNSLSEVCFAPGSTFGKGTLSYDGSLNVVSGAPELLPALFAAGCVSLDVSRLAQDAEEIGPWALASSSGEKLTFNALSEIAEGGMADVKGIKEIDARGLGKSIPEADEESFAGLTTADIRLIVSSDSEDLWRSHPVWSGFDVIPDYMVDASTPTLSPSADGIAIEFADGVLSLSCEDGLESISIYSPDGLVLLTRELSGTSYDMPFRESLSPDNPSIATMAYVVVLVKSRDNVKAMKVRP